MMTVALFAMLAADYPPIAAPPAPRSAIVLFVAGWCAPCHAEVRELAHLRRAAGDRRILVAPIDDRRNTRAMMARVPADARLPNSPAEADALMRGLAVRASGLPLAVATDARGRACGVWRKGLAAHDVPALVADCRD